MREIDPQSERLTDALRRLAASSPQSAPPQVAAGLLGEFRRHHARRRRNRQIAIAGFAVCLVVAAVVLSLPHRSPNTTPSQTAKLPETTATPVKQEPLAIVPVASVNPGKSHVVKQASVNRKAVKPTVSAANRTFLALPGYDPTVPLDELHVVRVQVPASALWQMGAPVSANVGTHSVTADFVVSQGGTPYAVRLVQ